MCYNVLKSERRLYEMETLPELLTELFPGYREHTAEERDTYSEFIDSFFEEEEDDSKHTTKYTHA